MANFKFLLLPFYDWRIHYLCKSKLPCFHEEVHWWCICVQFKVRWQGLTSSIHVWILAVSYRVNIWCTSFVLSLNKIYQAVNRSCMTCSFASNKNKKVKLQFPWDISELIDMTLCTWTYYVLSFCNVSSKSIKRLRRSFFL